MNISKKTFAALFVGFAVAWSPSVAEPNHSSSNLLKSPSTTPSTPSMKRAAKPPTTRPSKGKVIRWDAPKGWKQIPAFRIFIAAYQPTEGLKGQDEPMTREQFQVTLSTLKPAPYTLPKNARRWLKEVGVELAEPELESFLSSTSKQRKNKAKLSYTLFDTRRLKLKGELNRHLVVAVVDLDEQRQLFIKMLGDGDMVKREFKNFKKLIRSVRLEAPSNR